MKKGMSIPINTIIILAVGLIVLLGIVAFFVGAFGTPSSTMKCQAKLSAECQKFVSAGGCDDKIKASDMSNYGDLVDAINCTLGYKWNPPNNQKKLEKAESMCCMGLNK
ncbi:MAG: hypothetical protein J7K87_03285 [Candidatus Aenigmarchaeota archaeon]|nr:hypothetical protein [Candidatus Aenigmarchaeota archaeon]